MLMFMFCCLSTVTPWLLAIELVTICGDGCSGNLSFLINSDIEKAFDVVDGDTLEDIITGIEGGLLGSRVGIEILCGKESSG